MDRIRDSSALTITTMNMLRKFYYELTDIDILKLRNYSFSVGKDGINNSMRYIKISNE